MKRFKFWTKWFKVVGVLLLLLSLYVVSQAFASEPVSYVKNAFFSQETISLETLQFYRWCMGVTGAIWMGFCIFIVFMVYNPFSRKENWGWWGLFITATVWFVIDTIFSIMFGILFNALGNCIVYILILLPLIFTKKEMIK